jgi:hypothetical protein
MEKIDMSLLKYLLAFGLIASSSAFAAFDRQDGSPFAEELNESDFDALRDFVKTKRDVPLSKKSTNMVIAGDVRFEWRNLYEKGRKYEYPQLLWKNRNLRGHGATDMAELPISKNDFDVEFNLYFDYTTDRAWAVAQLNFDNSAGVFDNNKACNCDDISQALVDIILNGDCGADPEGWHGSGSCEDICLKKAYIGYNIFSRCDERLDVELGRRRLYSVFDSKIQFLSQFDGILFKYSNKFECVSDFYINTAWFVVDERVNHFGYVTETGFMNVCDSGFDAKYSFIYWPKMGKNRCFYHDPAGMQYVNSQFTLYYHFDESLICKPVTAYGAFLINMDPHDHVYIYDIAPGEKVKGQVIAFRKIKNSARVIFNHRKTLKHQNLGWYVGLKFGDRVSKEGDWSFDARYEYVEAAAVGDGDVNGIGRGNVLKYSFTQNLLGNANFKGMKFEFLYALTDNFVFNTTVAFSKQIDRSFGGAHHYSYFKTEAVYAF